MHRHLMAIKEIVHVAKSDQKYAAIFITLLKSREMKPRGGFFA